jgi:primosomal protein N'
VLIGLKDLRIAGPAPAPLLRAETYYRYQIMLRTSRITTASASLAELTQELRLPGGVTLTIDIYPVDMG